MSMLFAQSSGTPPPGRATVIGVDAGGTSTRALLVAPDGAVLGRGRGPGANLNSSGGEAAVRSAIERALAGCLAGTDPDRVIAGVIGVAGAGPAAWESVRRQASAAWSAAGVRGALHVSEDIVVAFTAGTPCPAGLVLISGTGAVAGAIRDGRLERQADGYGWIAGDEGSAVWLGLRAIRAALAASDGRGPDTALVQAVDGWLPEGVGGPWGQRVVAAVHGRPANNLGALAPLVASAAEEGDAVAAGLIAEASERLWAALRAVAGEDPPAVVVLAGSVIRPGTPVGRAVRAELHRGWPDAEVATAASGEAGAAALALAAVRGGPVDPVVHGRLTAAVA